VKRTRGECTGKLSLDESALLKLPFHLGRKEDSRAAGPPLGGSQREVGAPGQRIADAAVMWGDRNTNADTKLNDLIDPDWANNRLASRVDDIPHDWELACRDQEGKFVAPQPGHPRPSGQILLQALAEHDEHLVAAGITQCIIDLIKAVEIEDGEAQQ